MTHDLFGPAPILPPKSADETIRWLQLYRSRRVGPATFYRLMTEHGSAGAALLALPEVARTSGVKNYACCDPMLAEQEYRAGMRAGFSLICAGSPHYPIGFARLSEAPPLFWAHGRLEFLSRPLLSIVGARNASSLGTRMARKLADDLGRAGFVVVSGLARGVDAAAHLGALPHGTIAVVAGGVDVVYPAENTDLAANISRDGLVISEQPLGLQPQAPHFPQRNRLISGLAKATIVIEAALKSGSLITARNAGDQGRDVLVVPGHPFDGRSGGCNALIRDGATLVRNADDVIEAIGTAKNERQPLSKQIESHETLSGNPIKETEYKPTVHPHQQKDVQSHIMALLSINPIAEDQLIRDLDLPSATVSAKLLDLELEGAIMRQSGGLLSRVI
ncbi:DNA processing protein DprA, putative [Rhodobacterales bacterium HTCC2150]|nr:DNA processing protein DprA, putative [Rhodobacterales bacterium HTCC2150] [Rhodobacteraceae bacterium HTCC2150]